MTKSIKMILIIVIALGVLAAAVILYFKFFVIPLDKDGMIEEAKGGPHVVRPGNSDDTQTETDAPMDGGVIDNSDPNAPKIVTSTQIISFDCQFSTMDLDEAGVLGNHIYSLQAKLENGAVKGTYQVSDTGAERSFRASHDFLNEIKELVEMYDFAQYNGHSVAVSGLPDEYGAQLEVRYASGESIYASDNQDNYLSTSAMDDLIKLFERGASTMPSLLELSADTRYESEALTEGYGEIQYPIYHLDAPGYDALLASIAELNEARLDGAIGEMGYFHSSGQGQLYCLTDAYITRADSEVVSFYERTRHYESADWEGPMTEVTAHNLDARTGRELSFSDVFRNVEYLPQLLLTEFEKAYPQQAFYDDALDFIRQSIEAGDGNISFALGYGCVHVFANESVLNDEAGGQHITLSYILHPDQVRAFYTAAPYRWMIPMDDGTVYWRTDTSDCFRARSTFGGLYQEDVIWEVMTDMNADEGAHVEPFYGQAPECWLVCVGDHYYIYLRVPMGDVSMLTKIYRVTADKVTEIKRSAEPFAMALRSDTPLDPERMLMNVNTPIVSSAVMMQPYAEYRVDSASGLPQRVSEVYELDGPWVALRNGGRYNPADIDEASVSGGMWTLVAGERMRPYQTDMECFLDFVTEDERVVRFTIDCFADDMQLDNFGTLDDVFLPEGISCQPHEGE